MLEGFLAELTGLFNPKAEQKRHEFAAELP
jgi:hypothetical protein